MRVIEQYRELMLVPVFLVATLGVLSLTSLLFGNVVSRGQDLALLNAAGATQRDRVAIVLLDGLFLGVMGSTVGVAVAFTWTAVLVDRTAESLGFDATLSILVSGVWLVVLAGALLSVVAAAGPAQYMVRRSGFGGLIRTE